LVNHRPYVVLAVLSIITCWMVIGCSVIQTQVEDDQGFKQHYFAVTDIQASAYEITWENYEIDGCNKLYRPRVYLEKIGVAENDSESPEIFQVHHVATQTLLACPSKPRRLINYSAQPIRFKSEASFIIRAPVEVVIRRAPVYPDHEHAQHTKISLNGSGRTIRNVKNPGKYYFDHSEFSH